MSSKCLPWVLQPFRWIAVVVFLLGPPGYYGRCHADEVSDAIAAAQGAFSQSRFLQAYRLAQQAEQLASKLTEAADPRRADALLLLADSMRASGFILQSEANYKRAIRAYRKQGKAGERKLWEAFSKLGLYYQDAGRYMLAGEVFRRARYWAEDLFGDQSRELASAFNRWATLEHTRREDAQARASLNSAYAILKSQPHDDPEYIRVVTNFKFIGLWEALVQASPFTCKPPGLLPEILGKLEKQGNQDAVLHLKAISAIGRYYAILSRFLDFKSYRDETLKCRKLADDYLRRALGIQARLYGDLHPYYAQGLIDLGRLSADQSGYDLAAKHYVDALRILRFRFHDGHPLIKSTLGLLKGVYGSQGHNEKADAIAEEMSAAPEYAETDYPVAYATTRTWNDATKAYGVGDAKTLSYGTATTRASGHTMFDRFDRVIESLGQTDRSKEPLSYAESFKILTAGPGQFSDVTRLVRNNSRRGIRFPDQALLFVHGYNVDHTEAVKRAAQIAYDLEFDGALMMFSWGSAGSVLSYLDDTKQAEAAAEPLLRYISLVSRAIPNVTIHIIAHSMGNRVLSRAMEKLAKQPADARPPRIGEIIMAHADVDLDWCRRLGAVRPYVRGITNYVNSGDWALWISSSIRLGAGRCGRVAQSYPGIDTIDTTGMGGRKGIDVLGFDTQSHHGVFVNDPILFGDMSRLLATGRRPIDERTPEFRPKEANGMPVYWAFDKTVTLAGE